MDRVLTGTRKYSILELNCGTGEDAVFFASRGHRVVATDISEEMLEQALAKVRSAGLERMVEVRPLDIRDPGDHLAGESYDMVFSNFGGLNCVAPGELTGLSDKLARSLTPRGRFVAVVMGKNCLWESFYFFSKGQWNKVFRRNTRESIPVMVSGHRVDTWYYDPADFASRFRDQFRRKRLLPLGFFLPPSYLEHAMHRRPALLNMLDTLEGAATNAAFLAYFSDHYIIDLARN